MMEDSTEMKEEINSMEEGDSKELLKAAYKASMKKKQDLDGKHKTKVNQKNAKMRKMFKSFSEKNKGV